MNTPIVPQRAGAPSYDTLRKKKKPWWQFERAKKYASKAGVDARVTPWLMEQGMHPLLAGMTGYLPDTGLAMLSGADKALAGASGAVADISAPVQGDANADRMARSLAAMTTEYPGAAVGAAATMTGSFDDVIDSAVAAAPHMKNVAKARLNQTNPNAPTKIGMFLPELPVRGHTPELERAMDMHATGRSRREIWDETGLYLGPDGIWRHEISDEMLRMNQPQVPNVAFPADEMMLHDELYDEVPDLLDMRIGYRDDMDINTLGGYNPDENVLWLNPFIGPEMVHRTAGHETQHAVQDLFQMEPGGNPILGRNTVTRTMEELSQRLPFDVTEDAITDLAKLSDHEAYALLYGEAEADNVAKRLEGTMQERRAQPPWTTMRHHSLENIPPHLTQRSDAFGNKISPEQYQINMRSASAEPYIPKSNTERAMAYATHEAQPFDQQHLPMLAEAGSQERIDYFNDPRSQWVDPNNAGRDVLYDAAGFGPLELMPTTIATGRYNNPATGQLETNPTLVARPILDVKDGGIDPKDVDTIMAVEGLRSMLDYQGATPIHMFRPMSNGDTNAFRVMLPSMANPAQMDELADVAKRNYGYEDVVDTGTGVTVTNFLPDSTRVALDDVQMEELARELGAPRSILKRGKATSVYPGLEDQWLQGDGAVTRTVLDWIDNAPPEVRQGLDQSAEIPKGALARMERDAELVPRYGATRADVQKLREIVGEGPGWLGRLRSALEAGVVLPGIAAALLSQLSPSDDTNQM